MPGTKFAKPIRNPPNNDRETKEVVKAGEISSLSESRCLITNSNSLLSAKPTAEAYPSPFACFANFNILMSRHLDISHDLTP
jgi:hypothetical protein